MTERTRELIGSLRIWIFMHDPDDRTPLRLLDQLKQELSEANENEPA